MKQLTTLSLLLSISSGLFAQQISNRVRFDQGQVYEVTVETKTVIAQQAMGQAIDFNVDAAARHAFKVTNSTEDNSTLNHAISQVSFSFDGMGQKLHFDSDVPKDLNGQFGKPIKELLEKKYDIVVDTSGKTLMALPEKIELAGGDPRMAMITAMMKDIFALVQPPRKGDPSFFKIIPDDITGKGQPWTTSYTNETGKFDGAYSITDISDTLITVDFVTSSTTVTKAEMMGNQITTTMNNKSTGKIWIDKATGMIREKTETTESNGTSESPFGNIPVTSKVIAKTIVKRAAP